MCFRLSCDEQSSTLAILRFRWVIRDKRAFKTLVLDLKDCKDGLYATLTPLVQEKVDFSVTSQVTAAAGRIDDLQAIQHAASDFEMLRNTASFKTFNLAIQSQPHVEASPEPQLEIPLSELRTDADADPSDLGLCLALWRTYHAVVEWKYYEANEGLQLGSLFATSIKRIHRLVQLLAHPSKPKGFQVLDCIGYTHDQFHARLGIFFCILEGSKAPVTWEIQTSKSKIWINLADLIEQRMPLLGHRMQLALTLTKSMIQLHATGWLHKGYESRSVIFFLDNMPDRTNETGECQDTETSLALPVDIRQPKIVGSKYSRPRNNAGLSKNNASFWIGRHEAYIHPVYLASLRSNTDLESSPMNRFKAEYDMFSLGRVLLEIDLWRRLTEFWKPATGARSLRIGREGWVRETHAGLAAAAARCTNASSEVF
jgi:Prion-inhibition and propagation